MGDNRIAWNRPIEVQQMNAAEAIKMAQKIIDRAQASIDAMREHLASLYRRHGPEWFSSNLAKLRTATSFAENSG